MDTPGGRYMGRAEMLHHLRVERLTLEQRRLALARQCAAIEDEMNAITQRLGDIRHAFGLLGEVE
jgi:hypothetical protein